MILAAGLSPAWQQILVFDELRCGEVNRAREAHWCASGKVLNVGRALHHLGAAARTLSIVGGESGAAICREFAADGIDARWVESAGATRVCTTILETATRRTTELVENARPLDARDAWEFRSALLEEAAAADVIVISGSLPAGVPADFFADCLQSIERCRPVGPLVDSPRLDPGRLAAGALRLVLDIRGPELLAALPLRPFLVKPNREELARTVGRESLTDLDLLAAMRELNHRGAEWVVVSAGGNAVFATTTDRALRFQPPQVEVVNPIGCGDCLAAGMACALEAGREPLDAIRWGLAAAADNATQLLPSRLERSRVEERARWIAVESLPGTH